MKNRFDKVLFDLDGTLTDSAEGIFRSVRYAIEKMGKEQPSDEVLMDFIGPPMYDSFAHTLGYSPEEASQAVGFYRERFTPLGIYENKLYPGIKDLLHRLSQRKDIGVYVATAKPLPSAITVLEYFKIHQYFDDVSGAAFDDSIKGKTQVIANLLQRIEDTVDRDRILMIGDRHHDIDGARKNGIRSLGVLYGYGNKDEIGHADYVVETVEELKRFLLGE